MMTTVSINTKEPKERVNGSRTAPSLLLVDEEPDFTLVIKLVEATRERKLAALKISELAKQAVDKLLYAANTVACPQQE